MCLSKVYVDKNGKRELLMEEVASIEIGDDDKLFLKTLFGEHQEIEGNIRHIDFLKHSILLKYPK